MSKLIYLGQSNDRASFLFTDIDDISLSCEVHRKSDNKLIDSRELPLSQTEFSVKIEPMTYCKVFVVSKENIEFNSYDIYFGGETIKEKFNRLNLELTPEIAKVIADKNFDYDNIKEIFKLYQNEKNEDKRNQYFNVLRALLNDYNNTQYENNDAGVKLVNSGILELVKTDEASECHTILIVKLDSKKIEEPNDLYFNSEDQIKHKLQAGIYQINVYNDIHKRIQSFLFISYSSADNAKIKEDYIRQLNFKKDIVAKDSNENKIINILSYFDNDKNILPLPCLEKEDNDHFKVILSKSDNVFKYYEAFKNAGRPLYLYLSEEDELFNEKANYRKIELDSDSNLPIDVKIKLNKEHYYYWVGDDKAVKITKLGIFDYTNEDEYDYNLEYAKIKLDKTINQLCGKSEYKDKIREVLNIVRQEENDFPYYDLYYEIKYRLLKDAKRLEEYDDIIKAVCDIESKDAKKFDHNIFNPVTVKDSYHTLVVNLKEKDNYFYDSEDIFLKENGLILKTVGGFTEESTEFHNNKLEHIMTIKVINTKNWTFSRYIKIVTDHYGFSKILTNGLDKEVINGL